MISKTRSFRVPRNPIGVLILLAAFAVAAGCSTANTTGGGVVVNHVDASGNSVPGWVTSTGGSHANSATMDYIANGGSSSCTECHGSDLSGGISGVSCFGNTAGCHHGPIPNWATPAVHGATAKKAPGSSGFASCQICHGADFRTVRGGSTCFTCHTTAPHAPRPWRGPLYTHANTDTANAPVCAQCHYPNSPNNPENHPATPAPAGTAPGCFNNTLCHGEGGVPHPVDNTWVATSPAAQPHGVSAKATPGAAAGYAYCQTCHGTGTNFSGGTSGVSCYTCHVPTANSPHASQWRTGDTYVHTTTAEGNAPVCGYCHLNGANSPIAAPSPPAPAGTAPGCFNSTLCHGQAGHPAGWVAVPPNQQPHGTAAKAANGYPGCQTCHGASFTGSGGAVSCLNTTGCHGAGVSSPHPPRPWDNAANYTHTDTSTAGSPGNLSVCANCHLNGANLTTFPPPSPPAPPSTPPGCFNGTLCHSGGGAAPHPVPYNDNSHYTVDNTAFTANCLTCHDISAPSAKAGPICQSCHVGASPLAAVNCTSCHASPPDGGAPAGAAYPNISGAHTVHLALNSAGSPVACDTCHNGLGPSLANENHYDRAKSRIAPGDVAFLTTYNASSGTSTFDNSAALSCSNVSCHGALATPNWRTGTTACTSCHNSATVAPASYTDYTQSFITHNQHINRTGCTTCHTNMPSATHFGTLSDQTIPSRAAAATINPAFSYPSPPPASLNMNNCNTNSVGGCH